MTIYGTEVIKGGRIVASSQNLRGMRDYARRSPVAIVETCRDAKLPGRGVLAVTYADGAHCLASFASYHIMIDFVRRRRTWRAAKFVRHDEDMGYLTKPGIIAGGQPKVTP